jgi:hypothetical protein
MIATIVAPLGWLSSAITVACLESERGVAMRHTFEDGVFAAGRLPAGRAFAVLLVLLLGMSGILSTVDTASSAVTTEAPP